MQPVPFSINTNDVDNLVRLSDSIHDEIRGLATRTLENTNIREPVECVAVDEKSIPSIVGLLSSTDNAVLCAACKALADKTDTLDTARESALNAQAIPALVRLLSSNDVTLQERSATALRYITRYDPAQRAAGIAIPPLIGLLSSTDNAVLVAACAAFNNIRLQKRTDWVAVDANVIPPLIRLISSNDNAVFVRACHVLCTITVNNEDNATSYAIPIPPLVRLLSSTDEAALFMACRALRNIARQDCANSAVVDVTTIRPLVRLLSSTDDDVLLVACQALQNITRHDGADSAAADANAIRPLVRLLSSSNNAILLAACKALFNIVCDLDRAQSSAVKANAIPSLRHLKKGDYDTKVREQAVDILSILRRSRFEVFVDKMLS
jgi:hypothetical protein